MMHSFPSVIAVFRSIEMKRVSRNSWGAVLPSLHVDRRGGDKRASNGCSSQSLTREMARWSTEAEFKKNLKKVICARFFRPPDLLSKAAVPEALKTNKQSRTARGEKTEMGDLKTRT